MKHLMRAASGLAVSWLALDAAAVAQTGAPPEQPNNDVIVITGEKVAQDLQKTVSSVGVVTGAQMETEGVTSLAEAFDYVANVNMGNTDGGFSIRGIPFDSLLGAGSAPLAQIYVDDVTLGDQTTRFNADHIWDVSQIEVLRGAQSTVQGRNALAGAVVIRTQDPTFEWGGKARAFWQTSDIGSAYTLSAAGGGPIIDDVLAFRVAAERSEDNGFYKNPLQGGTGADFNDHWQGRAKLLFTPNSSFRSLLTYSYSEAQVASAKSDRQARDANGYTNLGVVIPGEESRRLDWTNAPDFNKNTSYQTSWKNEWFVNDDWTLTSISTYARERTDEMIDTDGTNLNPALFPQTPVQINNPYNIPHVRNGMFKYAPEGTQLEDQTIITQELTGSFDNGGALRMLMGGYYAGAQEREYNFTPGIQKGVHSLIAGAATTPIRQQLTAQLNPLRGMNVPGTPLASIPAGAAGDAAFAAFVNQLTALSVSAVQSNYADLGAFVAMTSEPLDTENFALYFRGEYDLTDKLTVGLGIRYDNERQTEGLILSGDPLGLANPAAPNYPAGFPTLLRPLVPQVIGLVNQNFDAFLMEANTESKQRFEAVMPSGFIRYELDDDQSVAFAVRRGYRAGGADLNIVRQFVSTFDPEYTTNYELAYRSYWFDRALRLNANVFYTDWTDQQVVIDLSTLQQDQIGFNVGSSSLYGFELEGFWRVNPNFAIQGVLGHVKTKFEDFDGSLARAVLSANSVTAPIDLDQTLAAFSGRGFSFAPEWTGAMRFIYEADNGLFGTLGLTYQGESFVNNTQSSSPTFLDNDARLLVNLTAGYKADNYTISVIAQNLLDEEYVSSGGNEYVRMGSPRVVGVQLQTNF